MQRTCLEHPGLDAGAELSEPRALPDEVADELGLGLFIFFCFWVNRGEKNVDGSASVKCDAVVGPAAVDARRRGQTRRGVVCTHLDFGGDFVLGRLVGACVFVCFGVYMYIHVCMHM